MTQLRLTPTPLSSQLYGLETTASTREVTHFLALQEYLDPADLEFLWQCRLPRATWDIPPRELATEESIEIVPGALRTSARSVVHGPYLPYALASAAGDSAQREHAGSGGVLGGGGSSVIKAAQGTGADGHTEPNLIEHPAGFPHGTAMVWALTTLQERGEPPFEGGGDRDGLARVFAEGLPQREEFRQVSSLVALARFLGGSAHFDAVEPPATRTFQLDSERARYRSVVPDPAANVDRIIYSDVWLDPAAALRIGQLAIPTMGYLPTNVPWDGPADPEEFLLREHMDLTEQQIADLHREADERDHEALAAQEPASAYGLVYEGHGGDVITVEIGGTDYVPPVLEGVEWAAHGVLRYRISWVPGDLADWQREIPSFDLRRRRTRIAQMVRDLTKGFYAATSGEITDQDGFLHDPAAL